LFQLTAAIARTAAEFASASLALTESAGRNRTATLR
jgi:hypothetical protein